MSIISTKSGWIRICFLFGLLSLTLPGYSQIVRSARAELPLSDENSGFEVLSAQEKGVVLFRRIITEDLRVGIELVRLDTALKTVWTGFIPIARYKVVEQTALFKNVLYLLFRDPSNGAASFEVVAVNTDKKEYVPYAINNVIQFTAREFVVTDDAFFIGGYFNSRPLVLHYSITTQKARVLPGFLNEVGELQQLKVYENGAIDVIVGAKNIDRRKCLFIRNYDAEGNLNKTIILDPGPGKQLIFGQSVKMPGDEQVVAGVYGRTTEYSRGVFVARIDAVGEYQINYYNFGDLDHFFNYMKAKREKRVMERIERRKIKGKKIRFNYRLLVHGLIPYEDKYLLIGEAFYPTYRYRSDIFTRDVIFDGYKYTHAVVIGLSKNGKLLWDNSFEINDIKSFVLKEFVKMYPGDDRIVLLYLFNNNIRSKIISGGDVVEGKATEPSEKKPKRREVYNDNTEWSQLEYWYDGNFFAYGVQRIKGSLPGDYGAKKIFFVNKLAYK